MLRRSRRDSDDHRRIDRLALAGRSAVGRQGRPQRVAEARTRSRGLERGCPAAVPRALAGRADAEGHRLEPRRPRAGVRQAVPVAILLIAMGVLDLAERWGAGPGIPTPAALA